VGRSQNDNRGVTEGGGEEKGGGEKTEKRRPILKKKRVERPTFCVKEKAKNHEKKGSLCSSKNCSGREKMGGTNPIQSRLC